jgi:hypothetical protein
VTKPRFFPSCFGFFLGSKLPVLASVVVAQCLALCCFAQEYYPNKEVRIADLPSVTAKSKDASDVLAASLEIILRDKNVCCGKNSALEDDVQRADPKSLKDVAAKLQGRHLLSDGRPILVAAEYVPALSVNSGSLITALTDKQAPLMEWDSHLYVVHAVIFDLTVDDTSGAKTFAIRKFLLLDARYSDQRREVSFDRLTDDWGKVQGLLMLKAAPQ